MCPSFCSRWQQQIVAERPEALKRSLFVQVVCASQTSADAPLMWFLICWRAAADFQMFPFLLCVFFGDSMFLITVIEFWLFYWDLSVSKDRKTPSSVFPDVTFRFTLAQTPKLCWSKVTSFSSKLMCDGHVRGTVTKLPQFHKHNTLYWTGMTARSFAVVSAGWLWKWFHEVLAISGNLCKISCVHKCENMDLVRSFRSQNSRI